MKVGEILGAFIFAFLGTWVIQNLFFDKKGQQATENISGKLFIAEEVKPLNTEVDFVDEGLTGVAETINIETAGAFYQFNSAGAVLDKLIFKRKDQDAITMVLPDSKTSCERAAFLVALSEKTPYQYSLISHTEENEAHHIVYAADFFAGIIQKEFIVYKERYQIDLILTLNFHKKDDVVLRVMFPSPQLIDKRNKNIVAAIFNTPKGAISKTTKNKLDLQQGWFTPSLFGTEGKYFIFALVADRSDFAQRAYFKACGQDGLTSILEGSLTGMSNTWSLSFYFGPKLQKEVAKVDDRLEQTFDYSGILAPLARLILAILSYLYTYCHNYGLAIIGLTILIKLILFPFTASSAEREEMMKKRKEYSKKIRYIKQKYKDDPEIFSREYNILMKEAAGSTKIGGMLFALLQLPILIALSTTLKSSFELYNASFLWIPDLAFPDPYYILPFLFGAILIKSVPSKGGASVVALALVSIAFMSYMPSGVVLCFVVNSLMGTLQDSISKWWRRG